MMNKKFEETHEMGVPIGQRSLFGLPRKKHAAI